MYLILSPYNNISAYLTSNRFSAQHTTDMTIVAEALKVDGVKVYKLDSLTELKQVEVTYKEIT